MGTEGNMPGPRGWYSVCSRARRQLLVEPDFCQLLFSHEQRVRAAPSVRP